MENKKFNFDHQAALASLFLSRENVKKLSELNHMIGLHSHTHPTKLELLALEMQKKEYVKNKSILEGIIGSKIISVSHPLCSYDQDTLKILDDLGIEIGFRDNMKIDGNKNMSRINNSNLELAREDHANILRLMN